MIIYAQKEQYPGKKKNEKTSQIKCCCKMGE